MGDSGERQTEGRQIKYFSERKILDGEKEDRFRNDRLGSERFRRKKYRKSANQA